MYWALTPSLFNSYLWEFPYYLPLGSSLVRLSGQIQPASWSFTLSPGVEAWVGQGREKGRLGGGKRAGGLRKPSLADRERLVSAGA